MVVLFSGVEAFDVVIGEEVEPGFAGGGVGDDDVEGVERGDVDEGDLVDLAAVEDEDLLLRAAQHRLLCLRVELGRIRHPGLEVDALAGHDGRIDVVVPQHLLRLVADQRERIRLQPPAGQDDRPAIDAVALHAELDRGGVDGCGGGGGGCWCWVGWR